ncbi:MAG: hypothetical protein J6Q59_03825, partial [Paludibacteraceae bacterium]|nr:hypothetical protein [Paludibacteraceae bacterium]
FYPFSNDYLTLISILSQIICKNKTFKIFLRGNTAKNFGAAFQAGFHYTFFARDFVPGYRRYAKCCLPGRGAVN